MKKTAVVIILFVFCNILVLVSKYFYSDDISTGTFPGDLVVTEGSYTGRGAGFVSDIVVEVVFERIDSGQTVMSMISVLESDEVGNYWTPVKDKIITEVLKNQHTDIDSVTGATESSQGLLEAIKNARKKAISRY